MTSEPAESTRSPRSTSGGFPTTAHCRAGLDPQEDDSLQVDRTRNWARKCLMAMKPMDEATPSYQLGEQITADLPVSVGGEPGQVYDGTYGLSHSSGAIIRAATISSERVDQRGGARVLDDPWHRIIPPAACSSVRAAHISMTQSHPIVYMASCSNGQPEYPGNLGYSVLARGGVTTFSASRVSWYYIRETDFTHSDSIGGLGYQYARFLTVGMEPCGRAAMDAQLANPMAIWPNHLVFNLYGDPSVRLRHPADRCRGETRSRWRCLCRSTTAW